MRLMENPGEGVSDILDAVPGAKVLAADQSPIRGDELMILLMLASVQFTSIVDFMVVMPLGPQLMRTLGITPRSSA